MNISINGTTLIGTIERGQTYRKSLDGELRSLTVIYRSQLAPNFQVGDLVTVDGNQWLVGSITSSKVIKGLEPNYRTVLVFVETTKYLERFVLPRCSFTNLIDTLAEQITKLLYKAETLRANETPRFTLSTALTTKLGTTPSEEFIFNEKLTLREALDVMLGTINCRVRINNVSTDYTAIELGFMDLNPDFEEVSTVIRSGETISQSFEQLASDFETELEHAMITQKNAFYDMIYEEWQTVKPVEGSIADTNNVKLVLSTGIEELSSVQCKFKSKYTVGGIDYWFNQLHSITSLFVESEIYNTMTLTEQEEHIPYVRGSKAIGVLDTYKPVFITRIKLNAVLYSLAVADLDDYLTENEITPDFTPTYTPSSLFEELIFQVIYYGYRDIHYKQGKENIVTGMPMTLISNQLEPQIDLERQGKSLRAISNRLGNKVLEIDCDVASTSEMLELGERIGDNYTLIISEYSTFFEHIKAHYTFLQNYSMVLATKLNSERRLYKIPISGFVNRDVFIKEYIKLSTTSDPVDDGILIDADELINTFNPTPTANDPIEHILVNCKDNDEVTTIPQNGRYSLKFIGTAIGNNNVWHAQFYDNYSAGLSTTSQVIGGRNVFLNPYVDVNGEFKTLALRIITSAMSQDFGIDDQLALGKLLPLVTGAYLSDPQANNYYIRKEFSKTGTELIVYKDKYETIGITYQLEFRGSSDVIVGSTFARVSSLIYATSHNNLRIYYSNTQTYRLTDNLVCKGTKTTSKPKIASSYVYTDEPLIQTAKSWAIGDENGNLLLAVNNPNGGYKDKIYFTISRHV